MSKRLQLWDDEAFKHWVREGAARRGMTLGEVLKEAGLTRFYLKSSGQGRMTNHAIAIADVLDDRAGLVKLMEGWRTMIPFDSCPHCRSIRFLAGPRGGSSQNVTCLGCDARFNLLIPPLPGPFLLLDELSGPREPPFVRGRSLAYTYIIELIPRDD